MVECCFWVKFHEHVKSETRPLQLLLSQQTEVISKIVNRNKKKIVNRNKTWVTSNLWL